MGEHGHKRVGDSDNERKKEQRADSWSMTPNCTSLCMDTAGHKLFSGIHRDQHHQQYHFKNQTNGD